MADTKKLLGAAAFTLALAGGGVSGALMGVPGISGAQESTTTAPAGDEATDEAPRHRHRFGGPMLAAAAEALGMTVDELRTELEAGATVAEIAGEQGVDVDTVIEAMVTSATDDIREHVTAFVNGEAPPGGPRSGHGHHRHGPGPGRP